MSAVRSDAEIEELLGAYALDAVDADERVAVEEHLRTCPKCRAEVESHREVIALLANEGAPAPEGLWTRIESSLEAPAPELRLVPAGSPSRHDVGVPRSGWMARAAAGALAAAMAVIAVLGVQLTRQNDKIGTIEAALAGDEREAGLREAVLDPGSTVINLTPTEGEVPVRMIMLPDGRGYLQARPLDGLSGGSVYQLWGDLGDHHVSLKVLGSNPDVVSFESSDRLVGLVITREREPGVTQPTGPIVATAAIPA